MNVPLVTTSLGAVADVKTGSKDNQDKVSHGKYPFFVRSDTVERIDSYSHDGEAILIPGEGRIGSIVHYIDGKFDVHQRVYKVSNFSPDVSGRYVYYYMAQFFGSHAMRNTVKATVDSLRLPTFTSFELRMPSGRREQDRIASALADSDDLIAALERMIAKKQAIKQGMMQQLLSGQIRLPGFTEPWQEATLDTVASIDPESLSASTHPRTALDYISLEDVERGELLDHTRVEFGSAPSRARRVIRDMDVLFGTVRPNLQSHTIYRGGLRRPIASTGFAVVRASAGRSDPRFLFYLLMSYVTTMQVDRIIAGSNYPAVSGGDVRRLTFVIPSLAEQRGIGSVLSDCDHELSALKHRLSKSRDIKQGMMQELLTGRTRLPGEEGAA